MNLNALDDILDPQGESLDAVLGWVNSRIFAIRKVTFTPNVMKTFAPVDLTEGFDHPLGIEASPAWRKFFLATLLADWAGYENPIDRADFARMKYIMTSAYPYTRLWGCRLPDGQFTPVGYTAWYPIAKFIYDGALNNRAEIDDRGVILPLRFVAPENIHYGYVFNISITKELFNTPCSQKLALALQNDLARLPQLGFLAITVAPDDAQKLCHLGNFVPAGNILVQGKTETLYVRRPVS